MTTKKSNQSELRREVAELHLLFDISQALEKSLYLRDVVGQIQEAMAKRMGMMRGTLTLLNRETGEIYIEKAYGLSKSQRQKGKYQIGQGITGKVVETGEAAIIPRISKEPKFLNVTGARTNIEKKDISFICVPIKLGTDIVGALSADRLFNDMVSLKEDVRLLSIIASMIAQAVKLRQAVQEEKQKLIDEDNRLREELKERFRPDNIIGKSNVMQNVFNLIAQVAKSSANVLIRGESGTGKELVANAIHYNSLRDTKPFIKVNCAALPETIVESELFGHEKGAFTGALRTRKGRFEMASGGTIFLDEVGDFSPTTQIKLLRFLQEREFERLGGNETIKADVRVVAATNRNLEELMEKGEFRQDLYYRLNVFPIYIPPLKHRKTDILLLADCFVEKYSKINNKKVKRISTPAIDMLMSYHWPGNVRELENCIERAVLLADDEAIHSYHLPPTLQTSEAGGATLVGDLKTTLDNVEYELIVEALKSSRGNMAKAARTLGITERLMGLRIIKHGIEVSNFKKQIF